jgi:gas vesicle protein
MEHSNNTGKIVGALVLGAAVGSILGILFPPDKGSETRKKIAGKSDELTDSLKEKFNDFLEKVKEEAESVKDKARDFMKDGMSREEKQKSTSN